MKYDCLIKNAKIIDGTGTPWFMGDVAVTGNEITAVGKLPLSEESEADCVIDAAGRILAPGFIDTHTHLDLTPFDFNLSQDPHSVRRLRQGITTQIFGCCGISAAPVTEASGKRWMERTFGIHDVSGVRWNSFGQYLDELAKQPLGVNYAGYVGHGAIRHCVMGYENRNPTNTEMDEMKKLLAQAMEGGAVGMSTGLIYAPGVFADTDELVELCSVLKDYNGIYASHIRSENAGWLESVKEVIEICEKNQIPGIVHHLKTKAKDSEELVRTVLQTLSDARNRGVDVVFEQYPYEASATGLDIVLSSWMHEGGKEAILDRLRDKAQFETYRQSIREDYGWKNDEEEWLGAKNMLVVAAENHPEFCGRYIDEIARQLGKEPIETVFHVLLETDLHAGAAFFGIKERDICTILRSPLGMVGSDSDDVKIGETTHPRTNGTFPRVLKRYVLDQGVISMETAIFKMTGFPAARFGLQKRGLIREGFFADLVLFDPDRLTDPADYLHPFAAPSGIDLVMVNGRIALQNGTVTDTGSGLVLRRQ